MRSLAPRPDPLTDFEIRDSGDVARLVRNIRTHADSRAIQREMYQALNRSTKGMRGELTEVMPAALPTSGGLSSEIQRTTKWRTSQKRGGVTLWARNAGHDIRTLTGKRLRKPLFGNRKFWFDQTEGVKPAVFLGKFEDQKPAVQRDIIRAMNEIARKVGW